MFPDNNIITEVNYGKYVRDQIFITILGQLINKMPQMLGNGQKQFIVHEAMEITKIAMNEREA